MNEMMIIVIMIFNNNNNDDARIIYTHHNISYHITTNYGNDSASDNYYMAAVHMRIYKSI